MSHDFLTPSPTIFPFPRELRLGDGVLRLKDGTPVLIPADPTPDDLLLARMLAAELADRYQVGVRIVRCDALSEEAPCVVAGTASSPLVAEMAARRKVAVSDAEPDPEGYALDVTGNGALIAGSDEAGALYGVQSFRQLLTRDEGGASAACARAIDGPYKPFRGLRMYLPGRDNIPFFKRFIRDFTSFFKYNTLILETNAAMWGDHFLESVRGVEVRETKSRSGYEYRMPGGLTPEQVSRDIPKDILVFNWFWNTKNRPEYAGNDEQLHEWGFEQVYGNFTPGIVNQDYGKRSRLPGLLGGAASSWAATNAFTFRKDLMNAFLGCANLLWSEEWPPLDKLTGIVQSLMPTVRRNFREAATPLEDDEEVIPLEVKTGAGRGGASFASPDDILSEIETGSLAFRIPEGAGLMVGVRGEDGTDLPLESAAVPVEEDPSSLVFLHACAAPASNIKAHFQIFNFDDTADLLGHYEIVYEDGFVTTVPIRYGINILEWTWARSGADGTICCDADPVNCAAENVDPITFFAFEWVNPRFGKVIREVRLKGSDGFVDAHGEPKLSNALMLLAMALTRQRPAPVSEHQKEDF